MDNFLSIPEERIVYRDKCFFIIEDAYPVSPGHMLIISNDAARLDYFTLTDAEKRGLIVTIDKAKEIIEKEYSPDGYNIGMNCGKDAGQSIMHFHCHVIPRYRGDNDNPRGGVRGVIPSKMNY